MSVARSEKSSRVDPLCRKWWVRVGDGTYGPYTGRQIRDFIAERRIVSRSVIRPVSGGSWRRACDDEILGVFFPIAQKLSQSKTQNASRKSQQGAVTLRRLLTDEESVAVPERDEQPQGDREPANVLVFAESGTDPAFENALSALGEPIKILAAAWLLKTRLTAQAVQERLGPALGQSGQLVVVDVTRQQSATFNVGSDLDVQIRQRLDTFA